MAFVIPYPVIDPVLIEIGPLAIRWYALAYLAGILLGWQYGRWAARRSPHLVRPEEVDDFVIWATLGIVLGGRLGYVLFYRPEYYLEHPLAALQVWHGGMSFHGGLLGVVIAGVTFCRLRKIKVAAFADLIFCSAPFGLFFGRIANFINGELAGRTTDVPWAMVFPNYGPDPRHPSQLYQAALEGLALFVILFLLWRIPAVRNRPGILSGVFLIGYGCFRSVAELFRTPDAHLGFIFGTFTMGQLLSLPMIAIGLWIVWSCSRQPAIQATR
ncbi:MAG: prolipoprotein diacylglyceryl transferase [Rhodospirillales bacterium]|nr:prolipoprotein diacylglyceryl transferase [Rhodospirillales bacterium]